MSKYIKISARDFNTLVHRVSKALMDFVDAENTNNNLPKFTKPRSDIKITDDYLALFKALDHQLKTKISSNWKVYLERYDPDARFESDKQKSFKFGIEITDGLGHSLITDFRNTDMKWYESLSNRPYLNPDIKPKLLSLVKSFCQVAKIPFRLED